MGDENRYDVLHSMADIFHCCCKLKAIGKIQEKEWKRKREKMYKGRKKGLGDGDTKYIISYLILTGCFY
jgi:hypothetical protein